MQKSVDKFRIIPIKTNRVIPYHYSDTSVNPKAKSNSDDRFCVDISKHNYKGITKGIAKPEKNRSSELDFAFGSTEVSK